MAGGLAAAAGYVVLDEPSLLGSRAAGGGGGGLIAPGASSGIRWQRFRPVAGGSTITIPDHDAAGTVAGGLEGPDGNAWALTCRHVVDPDYPDGNRDDVIGTTVYQATSSEDGDALGPVVDVGPSKGADATDWAIFRIDDDSSWSSHILALDYPEGRADIETGTRIVISGLRSGLTGGVVTGRHISANWSGTIMDNLIEYEVDDDQHTTGNSGAWIGTLDDAGAFRPAGIHAFRNDEKRYAIPLGQCVDDPDATIVDGGADPATDSDIDPYVEGAIAHVDSSTVLAGVFNAGTSSITDRMIELRDDEGSTTDSTTISLDALERTTISLSWTGGSTPTLSTGDETVTANAAE